MTNVAQKSEYDVVIVGGGHNGLSAGCYLAGEGKSVLVLEALTTVGGMASSSYAIPEAPQHLVHPCAADLLSLRAHSVVEELQLERHGFKQVELTPSYVYLHPDGTSLVFWRDPAKTAAEIRKFCPEDADAYLDFVKVIDALLDVVHPMMRVDPSQKNLLVKFKAFRTLRRHKALKAEIFALATGSAYGAAVERFTHPVTISALTCLTGAAGPVKVDGSGLYFAVLGFLHRFGIGRPIGGMQTIPNAMLARLKELGGEVRTEAPVAEIISRNGRATGVRLVNGEVINARAVVASCHPKMALDMVTPGEVERKWLTRIAMAPANAHGGSPLKVDIALRGQISVPLHQSKRTDGLNLRGPVLLVGTAEAVIENFESAARGEIPTLPWMWIATPSAIDPSQAPTGQDVVYIYPPAMPVNPREGWDAIRAEAVRRTLEFASQYVPEIATLEIGRRVETAPELAKRLNAHNGCVLHIDTSIFRSSSMRPAAGLGGDTLPIAGLFFGGAGIHPGGGVTGMPGKIAAGRVKRFLK
ncbi:phytoene desaturase family protein [Pseudomonas veronii]|uniref:phytoene desaturase family protein n=1 Tax=Pseudomonas veronii TaxID=76761 RepID=UPI000625B3AE|nr:NAD(P)/FAD-dependent oxidoreductase [Pseudomonas veronii]